MAPEQLRELADRIEQRCAARIEWHVATDDGAYCMAYSHDDAANPEREAREWLADHQRDYPERYAVYTVQRVEIRSSLQRDALTAAAYLREQAEAMERGAVAWRYQDAKGTYRYRGYVAGFDTEYATLRPVPLYLHPAPHPVPEGHWLAPMDPTEVMLRAMTDGFIAINGDNRAEFTRGYRAMRDAYRPAAPTPPPCVGNDPACPCQDGDICHYVDGPDGTEAMPIPAARKPADARSCTCHPDDNPPVPCARQYALSECRKAAAPADAVEALPYGIIDPDYARVFTIARCIAWQEGYAAVLNGSFTRDLDVLLVPWTEHARRDPSVLVARIAAAASLEVHGEPGIKPHGRKAWTLLFTGFTDPRFVDVSAMPFPAALAAADQQPKEN